MDDPPVFPGDLPRMDVDCRGVQRGKCTSCNKCAGFSSKLEDGSSLSSVVCQVCHCAPGKHLSGRSLHGTEQAGYTSGDQTAAPSHLSSSVDTVLLNGACTSKTGMESLFYYTDSHCLHCNSDVYFDINSGTEHSVCEYHLTCTPVLTGATEIKSSLIPPQIPLATGSQASSRSVCALEGCCNPRHVDAAGTVHECCGYTHAMELIRRKIMQGKIEG